MQFVKLTRMEKCDKMAGRRQALRPEFVQNIEFQQFLDEMFVHFAYRQTPENAVYYNQVKGRELKKN